MRSENTQEITAEGALSIRGNLPNYGSETPPGDYTESGAALNPAAVSFWFRKSILAVNQIHALYGDLTADGHLVGIERFELIGALDYGLNHFVQLRQVLDRKSNLTANHARYDFRMLINIRGRMWTGQGRLGRNRQLNTDAFQLWLTRLRTKRLPALIQFLGQALADGKLDQRERLILDRSIDRMIFGFILVRENVASGRVT